LPVRFFFFFFFFFLFFFSQFTRSHIHNPAHKTSEEAGRPFHFISHFATATSLSSLGGGMLSRVVPPDAQRALAILAVLHRFGATRVAVVFSTTSFGTGLLVDILEQMAGGGVRVDKAIAVGRRRSTVARTAQAPKAPEFVRSHSPGTTDSRTAFHSATQVVSDTKIAGIHSATQASDTPVDTDSRQARHWGTPFDRTHVPERGERHYNHNRNRKRDHNHHNQRARASVMQRAPVATDLGALTAELESLRLSGVRAVIASVTSEDAGLVAAAAAAARVNGRGFMWIATDAISALASAANGNTTLGWLGVVADGGGTCFFFFFFFFLFPIF
jgi:hypothetical protein